MSCKQNFINPYNLGSVSAERRLIAQFQEHDHELGMIMPPPPGKTRDRVLECAQSSAALTVRQPSTPPASDYGDGM